MFRYRRWLPLRTEGTRFVTLQEVSKNRLYRNTRSAKQRQRRHAALMNEVLHHSATLPHPTQVMLLRSVCHPNIVRIHEFLETPTHIYILLQYIRGGDMVELLKDGNDFSAEVRQRASTCHGSQLYEATSLCPRLPPPTWHHAPGH